MSETDRDGVLTPAGDEWRPRRHLRVLTALLAALALAVAAPGASLADDGNGDGSGRGGDNLAQAVNEKDGSFSIRRVAGEVVDEQNLAVAYASCVECQTVAIALQIVLVEGSPDTVTPTNVAIALNEECAACTTVALAYQFVVGRGGPVRFTAEGRRQLARIRREFQKLGRSGLSAEELIARAEELKAQVADVLANELVPVRDDDGERGGDDERSEGGEDAEGRGGGSGASDDDQGGAGTGAGGDREPTGRDGPSNGGESGGSPGEGDSGASPNGGSSGGGESPENTPPAGSGSSSGASP